jgi:hypothetical protein
MTNSIGPSARPYPNAGPLRPAQATSGQPRLKDRFPKVLQDLEAKLSEATAALRVQQPSGTFQGIPTEQLTRQLPPAPMRFAPQPPVHEPIPFEHAVRFEAETVLQLLAQKNAAYGNSAMNPVRIFSDAHPLDQILVRIDDKLSRIKNGHLDGGEDTVQDLIGYLLILQVARKGGV